MSKTIKIVTGSILLGASVIYLLIIGISVLRIQETSREDAYISVGGSIIEVKSAESEKLGQTAVTEWGETLTAESSSYEFYRLAIQVENRGNSLYFANPAQIFTISGELPKDVGRVVYPTMYELISYATTPVLPGKSCTTAILYVEVHSGVKSLKAVFIPEWKKDAESLKIILD